jgi:anti-sigma factor RsiW
MIHLSEQIIIEYIDRRLAADAAKDIQEHIALCAQCRQMVEFHKAIARSAVQPVTGLLADDFAERILRRVHVPARVSRLSWLLQNSSNIIAMVVVLGILSAVGYMASQPSSGAAGVADDSMYGQLFSVWNNASSSTMAAVSRYSTKLVSPVVSEKGSVLGSAFWIGTAALLALGLLDKLRIRLKLPTLR